MDKQPRTRIYADRSWVKLHCWARSYDDEWVEEIWTFSTCGGSYVRYLSSNGEWKQICHGFESLGYTMMCGENQELIDVIRDEYKRTRRAAYREWKNDWTVRGPFEFWI